MSTELKILRIRFGYSQQDVAEALGINKASYCRKERGEFRFSLEDVKKLKKIFELSAEDVDKIFLS